MKLGEDVGEGDHVEWCCASAEERNSHCLDQVRSCCARREGPDQLIICRVLIIVSLLEVDRNIVVKERLGDREEESID